MSNGGRQTPSQFPLNELTPFQNNTVISPEMYQANMDRLQAMRTALAFYEEQNNQGYLRYLAEKQQLEMVVEQGRLAAYVSVRMN